MSTGHVVARIGKPHALRGEVTVQLHTDEPEARLVPGAVLTTRAQPGSGVPRQLTIATTRVHRGIWLIGFEGIPDRTGAESLRGTRLVLDDDAVLAPEAEDEDGEGWYEEELVGLEVQDTAGVVLGTVAALELGDAQDRLVVDLADGGRTLVPFVEEIVPTVDLEAGHVVLDAPPGLLELGREG
ncbi:ribosome maturation factor RimM [Janibacter melonis]|uniref:ribosome maturation factor RimM n=1 Tax=Janibacter melonis TaxID=262209 RepID=UPI0020960CF5|nr:ribosome maturation factor RimM [Janibacter melonis]